MKQILCIILAIFSSSMVMGAIINVPADFATIQAGIVAAETGDTVLVADGTYIGEGNRDLTFAGQEITLASANGAAGCIIDCAGSSTEPHSGFVFNGSETETTILSGFTITNGYGISGGGIRCMGSAPKIGNCVITGNTAIDGGGLYLSNSEANIMNCTFSGNSAEIGGGIYVDMTDAMKPVIGGETGFGNIFENNQALSGADLFASETDHSIVATHNTFSGYHDSDYYVSPVDAFDLTDAISTLAPIEQDIFVAADGNDSNDGLTAITPFKTLTHALKNVHGTLDNPVTINLAAGTYSPSTTGETYPLPLVKYVTISGEDPLTTILDAEEAGRIFFGIFDDGLSLLDLTCTNGSSDGFGGAIYLKNSSPDIANSIFTDNTSTGGGAMYLTEGSSPSIETTNFTFNSVTGGNGGAIYCDNGSPHSIDTDFADNTADGHGGAIYCTNDSAAVIEDSIFERNIADENGGAIAIDGVGEINPNVLGCTFTDNAATLGGGVFCQDTTLTTSDFTGNSADEGGGIYALKSQIENCTMTGNMAQSGGGFYGINATIDSCDAIDNITSNRGGGFYCGSSTISDCTITGNTAEMGGGIQLTSSNLYRSYIASNVADNFAGVYGNYSIIRDCDITGNRATSGAWAHLFNSLVTNCTIAGNIAPPENSGTICDASIILSSVFWNSTSHEILFTNSPPVITYSNIFGGYPGLGNINIDPGFIGADNHQLQTGSPCIDTGTDQDCGDTDLLNITRPQGGEYDMGAYEYVGYPANTRTYIHMASHFYQPGNRFSCTAEVWNASGGTLSGYPLFVILDIAGTLYFAPGFNNYDYYMQDFPTGSTTVTVLPEFTWPDGVGSGNNIYWYAGLTNAAMTDLFGDFDIWSFGWGE